MQRAIVASVLRIPKETGEQPDVYARRRCRAASVFCAQVGEWDLLAADRIVSWHGHMVRNHSYSWANELIQVQDSQWMQARRLFMRSTSAFAGILGLREAPGRLRVIPRSSAVLCREEE